MEIIKDAFDEGRETSYPYDESLAKINELKLTVALENFSCMKRRDFNSIIPLQQIDPNTGKVLNTFPSRLDAAKWICINVLNRPNKNPISVTGNMEMCIRAGWKAYGYYWKILDVNNLDDYNKIPNGTRIYCRSKYNSKLFGSINEAAKILGIPATTLRDKLRGDQRYILKKDNKTYFLQYYNEKRTVHTFQNISSVSEYFGVSIHTAHKIINNKTLINNTEIKTKGNIQEKYVVFKGNKIVFTGASILSIAKFMKVSRKVATNAIKNNTLVGVLNYRIKIQ